jgi:RNA polymerase sigma factor (sigma-70 family)
MNTENKADSEPTKEQLREAEEGLTRLLFAKRFTREWIERQVPEAMAQAQADLAARIAAGREDETVGLLVVIAYRRALKALTAEKTKPKTVPVDEVFDLTDEYERTPEQIVMDADRQARLLRAMRYLPDRDKELLGLVYYGELDVKEAGRRLGWSSSSADRHHKAALQKLRALVGERSLLGADVAVPALIASGYSSPRRGLQHWFEAATDRAHDLVGWVLQRSTAIAETGSAVGMSGAGRTSAGVCGLAVAACMAAVTSGVVGPGIGVLHSAGSGRPPRQAGHHRTEKPIGPPAAPTTQSVAPSPPPAAPYDPVPSRPHASVVSNRRERAGRKGRSPKSMSTDARASAPAGGAQTTEEFGVEGGGGEALSQPREASSPPPPASSQPSKPAPGPSNKTEGGSEFGM